MDPRRVVRVDLGRLDQKTTERLLREFEPVAQSEVRRFHLRFRRLGWVDKEDLHALAQIATLEAHVTFDPSRPKVTARGWTRRIIRQRLTDALQTALNPSGMFLRVYTLRTATVQGIMEVETQVTWACYLAYKHVSLDEPVKERGGGEDLTYHEVIPDDAYGVEDALDDAQREQVLLQRLAALPVREQQILLGELRGQSGASVGREMGLSRQRVNKHRHDAFERLRAALSEVG